MDNDIDMDADCRVPMVYVPDLRSADGRHFSWVCTSVAP